MGHFGKIQFINNKHKQTGQDGNEVVIIFSKSCSMQYAELQEKN